MRKIFLKTLTFYYSSDFAGGGSFIIQVEKSGLAPACSDFCCCNSSVSYKCILGSYPGCSFNFHIIDINENKQYYENLTLEGKKLH